jgi:hypothetical protein
MFERAKIISDLKDHVIEVAFTKVNGERRVMRCTLDPRIVPGSYDPAHLDEQHARKENENVVACWDVVANGWRSFRVDSVEYMHEVEGYR